VLTRTCGVARRCDGGGGSVGGDPRESDLQAFVLVAVLATAVLLVGGTEAVAQSSQDRDREHFSGFYLGMSVGSQNLFGRAFIDGIDVLAQDRRRVIEFSAGIRRQFLGDHLLAGVEVQYGLTDGNLMYFDPPSQSAVSYENLSQRGFGLTLGYAGGPGGKVAIYSYLFATDRIFDVSIVDPNGPSAQTDAQSFLQYGLGAEVRISGSWHIDASVGRQFVDSSDLVTNIELDKMLDLTVGFVHQF